MGKVLIACEESQTVCKAFRELGHEAYSNDLIECSGGHPEWHLQMDCFEVIRIINATLVISFQPCTDLTVSGARYFAEKRINGSQEKSIRFFFEVWKLSNCSENPIGILNTPNYVKKWFPLLYEEMKDFGFPFKPSQIIQPWQFGHPETKATCLWLKNLPILLSNSFEYVREQRIHLMPPGPERSKLRSKTFPGIAKAMAVQWGPLI